MKISLITVVYNGETFLQECFNSVIAQTYANVEYIVIDGGSTDRTLNIIQENRSAIDYFVSEKDKGLYDAINKGIERATGEVIGILNADDLFAHPDVLAAVAKTFMDQPKIDGLYGDLNYIHPTSHKIIRKWKSRQNTFQDLQKGWMPAHPTLYLKRSLFEKNGDYALDLGTAADYELILRYFYTHKIEAVYLPILMVNMRMGGVSNQSVMSRVSAFVNDYKALKRNKVPMPFWVLLKKKLSKLSQF
ncbi:MULTISPECIES: glycosyltransferase family 2 protein [unclassified Pedobacter]|uniref:glycosyltransferase family 2 protein n=1 Tax=unclassified Pedobacter TaxID=2628915 RepID=UPI00141E40FD|nr:MULTISPECIES: glycosyltransferase family 2 protein [unclassified Pedobacter]NII81348.1 glycosyltransferase [Pedobacter sp. SG908]NMN35354.1 glycosyltransferase [Pedobacter sp. SG918]